VLFILQSGNMVIVSLLSLLSPWFCLSHICVLWFSVTMYTVVWWHPVYMFVLYSGGVPPGQRLRWRSLSWLSV